VVASLARRLSNLNVTASACAPTESITSAAAAEDFKNAVFMFCTCSVVANPRCGAFLSEGIKVKSTVANDSRARYRANPCVQGG
jgi:hypothetical protein